MKEYIDVVEKHLSAYQFGNRPSELYDPIRYILSLGGKRIRPVLTLMTCDMFVEDISPAIFPAMGVEVFHNFTLLHDDIMDNAPIRRGKETVHEKWGDNAAILSGDVMLVKAYELFAKTNADQLAVVLDKFNKCAAEVCEGQQFDMNFEEIPTVSADEYLEMIRLKTAVLLGFSIELGAILGGADQAICSQLYDFGVNIGIGFQLKDDLLDVYADSVKFGKQVGGDIISNKKTYLLIKALELAKGDTRTKLDYWLSKQVFDAQEKVNAVIEIYDQLGIKSLSEQKMNEYFDRAQGILDSLAVSEEKKEPLRAVADMLIAREK